MHASRGVRDKTHQRPMLYNLFCTDICTQYHITLNTTFGRS